MSRQPSQRRTSGASYSERATQYASDVASGAILASKWTRLACERHLRDLEKAEKHETRWKWDEAKGERVCRFIEMLPHQKGKLQGQRVHLEDWQCFILCSIFCWVDRKTDYRRFREVFALIPRGNGKTPLAAWIGLWMAFFDGEKGSEVYCGAANKLQAHEVFKVAKAICEMVPKFKELGVEVYGQSIIRPKQQDSFCPVIGKPKDGASPYNAILDELHEQPTAEQLETFETGASKRQGSLILIISTAGSTTEGPCHSKQQDVEKVLDGTIDDDTVFVIIYTADPEVDWTLPEALQMANPNLYVSMDTEQLFRRQAEAARNPSKQNAFRNKHLNQWTNAATGWMNMAAWNTCADDTLREEDFAHDPCVLGSDLAAELDLCATVKVFRRDIDERPHYYAFCRAYLPQARVDDPANRHYQRWAADGYLTATKGSARDTRKIAEDSIRDCNRFQVRELAYDARYAYDYAQWVTEDTGVTLVVVPPSTNEFSPAMKELEGAVADGRFHYRPDPVLTWCMSNVVSEEWGGSGNYRMPDKQRPENKIDSAVALLIAISRARLRAAPPPVSVYETRGMLVL